MNNLGQKLQGFKEQHVRGNRAVTFIQETHLNPEEHDAAARQYVAMWGFKHHTAARFSFWASGSGRRAGVAILVNPYAEVTNMQPWKSEEWSEHLIMTTGELDGRTLLFVNIYAPSNGAVRVQFFRRVAQIDLPPEWDVICGGDFNCVLHGLTDRRGNDTDGDVGAKELLRLVEKWNLVDTGGYHVPTVSEDLAVAEYARAHHTHFHKGGSGGRGSSRIDRIYVSEGCARFVRGLETEEAVCRSDHRAVLLELHSPKGVIRMKKRPKVYPPPALVQAATLSLNTEKLADFKVSMADFGDGALAAKWGRFKDDIKFQMKTLTKAARQRATQGWRQKIKRIKTRLMKLGGGDSDGADRRQLLQALHNVQTARRAMKCRVLVASAQWSARATSKQFYKRICTKYGSNNIMELTPTRSDRQRYPQDKANILRDSWEEILNGAAEDQESIAHFIESYRGKWTKVDMTDLDDPISEEEVEAAIAVCKTGKACGPDELGNEWYQDHRALLVPILVKLFNECMQEGHTPVSFLEAYIFSIGKGGDRKNPLNYRPIALLNTDYKILTRILAWRVRKYVDRLVNGRQCGFVPGRTIHEVIDMLEAAKQVCKTTGELSDAQVLMLDFAKAYDSLDRHFLLAVLEAKGFPTKILRFIKAIHTDTTVQFMANGHLSDRLEVTSGIRQGCPLAPLLFIIAVDLLYDAVEDNCELSGIALGNETGVASLRIAGYADDTAIYIANSNMQKAAIHTVKRFSAVSGLKLNVKKSAAIFLGTPERDGGVDAWKNEPGEAMRGATPIQDEVPVVNSVRYLGHTAGSENTVKEAWTKAFAALKARLALAEVKTNTAQQRAEIAAAIIVPKLLYVARHAWPTPDLCKQADKAIRNYVWRSVFKVPERTPAGWVQATVAGQRKLKGGLGILNFATELMAMSAMVVGEWALTTNPNKQTVGDILQKRDTGECRPLTTAPTGRRGKMLTTLRATGRIWVEDYFRKRESPTADTELQMSELRMAMRFSNGLVTTWTTHGLVLRCTGLAKTMLMNKTSRRRKEAGTCSTEAIKRIQLHQIWVGNSQGQRGCWQDYTGLYPATGDLQVGDIVDFEHADDRSLRITPKSHTIPMACRLAHQFREISICLVTNFPELMGAEVGTKFLTVQHSMEDPHHVFEMGGPAPSIVHSWGTNRQQIEWQQDKQTAEEALAIYLNIDKRGVSIAPHPAMNRMQPLWTGNRRWTQSRKNYKALITTTQDGAAAAAHGHIRGQLHDQHNGVARALGNLTWKRIHRMEGASAYHTQTICKLKLNRLRIWAGEGKVMQCQASACSKGTDGGTIHLIWKCPEAQRFWERWTVPWTGGFDQGTQAQEKRATEIFGLKLEKMPRWLVQWGKQAQLKDWEILHQAAEEMWALGTVATMTAIWRWNVDRIHNDGRKKQDIHDALGCWRGAIREAYQRYRLRLFPITRKSIEKIQVAEAIAEHWDTEGETQEEPATGGSVRVGFFDGGSRGNPGPGGSGSVITHISSSGWVTPVWAAVTALGGSTMTNNIAEFVGLHRLLAHAASKGWRNIHVVGDSMLIIRMMAGRSPPKSRRLQPWYQATVRLADICEVASWSHHYRAHNKMADWLANQAMDTKKSVMVTFAEQGRTDRLKEGIRERMSGDVNQWKAKRAEQGNLAADE